MLAERVRDALPQLRVLAHCGNGAFKAQFKRADHSGARIALVLGEDELARGEIGIKHLRNKLPQEAVAVDCLVGRLAEIFDKS